MFAKVLVQIPSVVQELSFVYGAIWRITS